MKPLFLGLAPNMTPETRRMSLVSLLPWNRRRWYDIAPVLAVEQWLSDYFDGAAAYTFDSGRSALFIALRSQGIGAGDEVLLCGYTCIVVADAVVATGATPVYVDIDETLCINPEKLAKAITQKSKAVILQHTFGYPGHLDGLLDVARAAKLFIIEDCAHSLGSLYQGKKLGTFGDCAIISFGTDKIVSSVRGGALVMNDKELAKRVGNMQAALPKFPKSMLRKHLSYYPIMSVVRALFVYKIGGYFLLLARVLGLMPSIVSDKEKQGSMDSWTPCAYPGELARIALVDLQRLNTNITQRKKTADQLHAALNTIYVQDRSPDVAPLFFAAAVDDPYACAFLLRKKGILNHTSWSMAPIVPEDARRDRVHYREGSCPISEERAKHLLVFGTHPSTIYTPKHIQDIVAVL